MKKIIFFDADGTLWYPKKTKRNRHPSWIYKDKRYKNYEQHLELLPGTITALKKLKSLGIILVILSTSPHLENKAQKILMKKVNYFKLENLFNEVYATKEIQSSKGKYIEKILKEKGFSKKSALMVGDSYKWDYSSAQSKSIDALLVKTQYEKNSVNPKNYINKLNDIFSIYPKKE